MSDREYTAAEIRKFKRAAKALRELGEAGAFLYLNDDQLHLMSGPSHDENERPRQDRSVASEWVPKAGGGGW